MKSAIQRLSESATAERFWQLARENPFVLPAAIGVVGLLIWLVHLYWRRKISNWAESQGMKLVRYRGAWFFQGPHPFLRSKNQHVFRVIVEDRQGISHSAWLTFGTYWGFTWGEPLTDVQWDNETDY